MQNTSSSNLSINLFIKEFINKEYELNLNLDSIQIVNAPDNISSEYDFSTNIAMMIAGMAKKPPLQIAEKLAEHLKQHKYVKNAISLKPGFVNIELNDAGYHCIVDDILKKKDDYGYVNIGDSEKINIEYVSANPTGPIHVAHVRSAVYGSSLANLLKKLSFDVTEEYYINDAGSQIKVLSKSVFIRYKNALNKTNIPVPSGCYPGDYLISVAQKIAKIYGDKFLKIDEQEAMIRLGEISTSIIMDGIKSDLKILKVDYDSFVKESDMCSVEKMDESISVLKKKDMIYTGIIDKPKGRIVEEDVENKEQELFRSTKFGDDMDRPIKKSDGSYAYFAPDISYHYDKCKRGFKKMILILGADHKGYKKRITAAVKSLAEDASIDVQFCELVNLIKNNQKVKVSKRNDNFLTLNDLSSEIDIDTIRFTMLTRKNDTVLNFDLDLAKQQSKDNMVFYVQYAHSRCCSLINSAIKIFGTNQILDNLKYLPKSRTISKIISFMSTYEQTVMQAYQKREINKITNFAITLSSLFHSAWAQQGKDKIRFVNEKNKNETLALILVVQSIKQLISNCLKLINVDPLEKM